MSNVWDDFGSVETDDRNPFLGAGRYRLLVEELKTVESSTSDRVFFIAEFTVETSNNEMHPAGSKRTWMATVKSGKKINDGIAKKNVKNFVSALLGEDDSSQIDGSTMQKLCGDEQPAAGLSILAEGTDVGTKSGGEFTRFRFYAVPDSEQ